MKKIIILILSCFLSIYTVLVNASTTELASECKTNGVDYQQTVNTITTLQIALKKQDIKKIATLIDYPLRVNQVDNTYTKIKDIKNFQEQFNTIFNQTMQNKILQAKPADVACSWRGAMIADGTLWLLTQKGKTKIFSINMMEK